MSIKSIPVLKSYYKTNAEPTEGNFSDLIDSMRHKSEKIEQVAIIGLNGALDSKAEKSDLDNIVGGMINKGEVATKALLPAIAEKGWAYIVTNEKDPVSGLSYIYQYDGVLWNNTKLTAFPSDVATHADTQKIIKNLYSKYDIYTDEKGNVLRYNTQKDNLIEIYNNLYLDMCILVDENGWVSHGWDWKMRQLYFKLEEPDRIIPSIFDLFVDANGNVGSIFKTWSFPSELTQTSVILDRLATCFTKEVTIVQDSLHYGFPSICAGKGGILHAFYRKGLYHTGVDGSIMYSYSKDFGMTWNPEQTALQGGGEVNGWFKDYRDSRVIRMTNGKFLYVTFLGFAKENGGIPPYHVDYNNDMYQCLAVIYEENADGSINLASANTIEIPRPAGVTHMATAGGLIEYGKVIYTTVYGNTPNSVWLQKSLDFGLTWIDVAKIQDGYNENSIAFIGETMYCLMRAVNGNARIVKSNDYGITWEYVTDMDNYWHGLHLLGLGDCIMACGRAYAGDTTIIFFDKFGNILLKPIRYVTGGDSAYSQICTFENYVHIIYYKQLGSTSWGIYTRKIERSRVLGLSF